MAVGTNDPNPDTDPGQPHPYESLYRSAPGAKAAPSRPTPRHFEQHLSRPEGAEEGFGWLYRDEVVAVEPAVTVEPEPQAPVAAAEATLGRTPGPSASAVPAARRTWVRVLLILLLTLVGVGLGGMLTGWSPTWPSSTVLRDLVRHAETAIRRV